MRQIRLPPHSEASIKALAAVGYAQLEAGEVFTVQSKNEFVALVRVPTETRPGGRVSISAKHPGGSQNIEAAFQF